MANYLNQVSYKNVRRYNSADMHFNNYNGPG